ncbi:MAG: ACP S-malonyltransferase [Alphaproteobacteria bacterium]|nr:ACP S-malonyltransferase [Alphaproteobacteria bacterium]
MSIAFIFPGQGSQSLGMGKSLAEVFGAARLVFEEVDDALGEKLSRVMWGDDEEALTRTSNTQPALMAVSLAAMRALDAEFGVKVTTATCVAGHSLGEYSALAAAGAFTVADAARLLRRRGDAMQAAVPFGAGAMASLIGKVDVALAEEIAAEGAKVAACVVANDNNYGNVVISGEKAGVDAAIEAAKERGVRAILLNVSAPFHSPLMQPAVAVMAEALDGVEIAPPALQVIANVTAAPTLAPAEIRKLLLEQVTGRVRWRESVAAMAALGVTRFVEVGAGKVLTNGIKRGAPECEGLALNEPAQLEAFAKTV